MSPYVTSNRSSFVLCWGSADPTHPPTPPLRPGAVRPTNNSQGMRVPILLTVLFAVIDAALGVRLLLMLKIAPLARPIALALSFGLSALFDLAGGVTLFVNKDAFFHRPHRLEAVFLTISQPRTRFRSDSGGFLPPKLLIFDEFCLMKCFECWAIEFLSKNELWC